MNQVAAEIGLLLALAGGAHAAAAPTTELETTVGYSTQGVSAVAAQLRTFGELKSGLRYYAEAAGAGHSGRESDAFAAAYYYDNNLQASETYVEQQLHTGQWLSGVRAGRYRTPFGIYGRGDNAYNGFLRPPLVRYGYYEEIANYWLEGGADFFTGTPQLQLEVSLGTPQDTVDARQRGLDTVLRLQGYRGHLIVGASYMRTKALPSTSYIRGSGWYAGADARWLRNGVQLRGEWIEGLIFRAARMKGWYVDAQIHRAALGPVTPVLRYEVYRYDAPGRVDVWRRWTTGARLRVTPALTGYVNFLHQPGLPGQPDQALDVGITHSVRF